MSAHSGGDPPNLGLSTPGKTPMIQSDSDMELDSPLNSLYKNNDTNNQLVSQTNSDNINANIKPQKPDQTEVQLSEKTKTKQVYFYKNTDTGPYFVYIENELEGFKGKLNAIKIGDILFQKHPELDNKISSIESIGRNRIRIKFKDSKSANNLLKSTCLKSYNLIQYVPKSISHKFGIIRGVDLDLTEEYIKQKIQPFDMHCHFEIESVKRMHRKEQLQDGTRNFIPTRTIFISFRASTLPKYISINHVRIAVEQYNQKVLLCYNCFRYGHLSKQCKSNIRCLKCKEEHNITECQKVLSPKCFHCEGEHYTNEINKCQEYSRQKTIKKLMTENNLTYYEANQQTPKITYASALKTNTNNNQTGTNNNTYAINTYISNDKRTNISSQTSPRISHNQNTPKQYVFPKTHPHKRPKLTSSQNETFDLRKQILKPINKPSNSGSIINNKIYSSNIVPSTSKPDFPCLSLSSDSLINLILCVINNLKQQKTFDIQESALLSMIKDNLTNVQLSDEEFY